jgi:putative transposase
VDEAALRQRTKAVVHERRRFAYRRLHVLLRMATRSTTKKHFRLHREQKLAMRRRGGRKRETGTRAPMTVLMAPNDRRSFDFLSDQLTDGRGFRILTLSMIAHVWPRTWPADDRARQAEDGG